MIGLSVHSCSWLKEWLRTTVDIMKNTGQETRRIPDRSERGTSFVELAILLPFFILLILGTVDIGRGFSSYIGLTTAAREGARWLTLNPADANGAYSRIYQEAGRVGLTSDEVTVSILPHKSRYESGDEITVAVQYDHPLLFGFVPDTRRIPLNIRVTMVVIYD